MFYSCRRSSLRALLGSTALATLICSPAVAGNVNWIGITPDWQVPSNWSGNAVPTAADTVTINTVSPSPTILSNGTGTTGALYVGSTGNGSLTLDSGVGLTSTASSSIGDQAGGSGVVTVRGSTSWQITGGAALDIGKSGNGTLNISNGAQVAGTDVTLGTSGGSKGVANIDGANSELVVAGTLTVGNIGTGTINLTRGGQAIAGSAVIGSHSHAPGLVSVDGANSLFFANNVTVGSFGAGTVTVTNGGTLSAGSSLDLGYFSGEGGTVTVSGAGSMLKVGSGGTGALAVGVGSAGTLNMTSGASGSVSGGVIVGNDSNVSGTWNLSGTGTQFTVSAFNGNNGNVYAGWAGSGTISVADAAVLTAERFFVGNQANSSGVLNVQSGATVIANNSVVIAHGANSTGTVTVTGAGSSLTSANGMTIGDVGNGTLNVLAGANVSANGPTILGNAAGSTGTATIDGAGSHVGAGVTTIGQSGSGAATVSNGG
ncbi:MAG: hypothetical protein JO141_13290, partial [Bradyrhizobium sp.]|nr:hypothetical protein [Bradyrhizobium sp.]